MREIDLPMALMLMIYKAAKDNDLKEAMTLMGFVCKQFPDSSVLVTDRFEKMLEEVDFSFLLSGDAE